ncbi:MULTISPECIES: chorismate--pyruvate lyase family protein [Pseudoalteromonas]|uniref:Probable chorismate pyruvate-lyase n=1 Tax=Pseudoalteromonas haloplanktis TaxID=228 RepID=A0ABU1BHQ7_PSEHA|nr:MULTISPECIES: chorismate lyase [Pseudoalteromonas]MDQ9093286.1 chorismate lyase [Pseudoalteromonas haloplanktis]TMN74499.1 chorismate lyase [Pseudoalteromonas sp. S1727]BDF95453.1 putative chorismate pyruvate-lyase [Pseudoalteromonas sp. KAN5]
MITFPVSVAANWQLGTSINSLSGIEQDWLLEPNSLTAKLKQHCTEFTVQVLNEQTFSLTHKQQQLLACSQSLAINREVLLLCDAKPMVYAQSWLPVSDAMQRQQLLALGDRPLGDVIFQHPDLKRTEIEVAQFDCLHPVQQLVSQYSEVTKPLWGRRSVFSLAQSRFLVAEIFLPEAYLYL